MQCDTWEKGIHFVLDEKEDVLDVLDGTGEMENKAERMGKVAKKATKKR